ncbi:related to Gamm1 protein / Ni-binding urease accessory protein (UreG) [Serendipita indica DSM 11827]|uniref:Related to Gamm1 protein / Ni-binding urease accessory protein (UreG) n=1 Tax=Serendipita indica (strain DSM 11827) TaxID=1109443 RepID=G4TTD0_SERID|nr:related to Gamm1 protein / Ni-binding urease accessory protein (UreG) [Serendipita indica DSM 11827]
MAETTAKTGYDIKIGTHNGTFHCDEALAVWLLKRTGAYKDAKVIRTRDESVLATCDIVVDVGAKYEPENHRYDHHQRGFTEIFGHGFSTKLSSAGLVYKHFGREIISNLLQWQVQDSRTEILWLKMYKEFIEAIDAIDNGISAYPSDIKPSYRMRTDVSARVGFLNPRWNVHATPDEVDSLFVKASNLVGGEFHERLDYYGTAWLPAREIVMSALQKGSGIDERVLVFEDFAPWKEHLFDLEKELGIEGRSIYVLYPDESGKWRIQAVPVSSESFESRKALPDEWRGLRDDALSQATGVPGCVFVHASGFIGGAQTREGVEALARLALK